MGGGGRCVGQTLQPYSSEFISHQAGKLRVRGRAEVVGRAEKRLLSSEFML